MMNSLAPSLQPLPPGASQDALLGRVLDELLRDNRADLKGGTRVGSRFASW